MAEIRWKVVEHTMSKAPGKHVIVVGYTSRGKGGMGKVACAMPLYDLRDFNFDGSVSVLERAFSTCWYDPYELNSLLMPGADADFKREAGSAVRDFEFMRQAEGDFLRQAYKAAARAAVTISVERFLSPGIERNLANTALEQMGAIGASVGFVLQTTLETIIMETVCATSIR